MEQRAEPLVRLEDGAHCRVIAGREALDPGQRYRPRGGLVGIGVVW
jgi:hypothetical protein